MRIKKIFLFINLLILLITTNIFAFNQGINKVVYGEDDRIEVFQSSLQSRIQSKAIAVQIHGDYMGSLSKNGDYYPLDTDIFPEGLIPVCKNQRFTKQYLSSYVSCTGFLIEEDVLVTAGHCVVDNEVCQDSARWLFNFQTDLIGSTKPVAKRKDTYFCKKVLAIAEDDADGPDFAIVQLDRKVIGVTPLKLRRNGEIKLNQKVSVIGFPSGLPMKVTPNGRVRKNNKDNSYFITNSDTFAGNSGSPVINDNTGLVEGILIKGEEDYNYIPTRDCSVVNYCKENECKGESVFKITKLPKYKKI